MSSRREKYQQILTDNEMVSWALFTQFVLDEDLLVFVPLFVHVCECNSVSEHACELERGLLRTAKCHIERSKASSLRIG